MEEPSSDAVAAEKAALEKLFTREIKDLYRIYEAAEHYLCQPELLAEQVRCTLIATIYPVSSRA